ncbi:titin isoform X6 [Carya illinoinensis]|uniref:titin isoform X6 n=1 Tax=Carya illinoinensis TaxID=32201 RepID=UPI001C728104|nr:titin isoform X6 [Carya illinoinensis]
MVLSEDEKQLQEGERFETGEETGREVKDKMPRSNDTEEGLLEDDTTKVYSTVHSGEKIVKQIFQVDSPEEAASKSSGEDEGNNATVEEPHLSKLVHDGHGIQAIPREQIEKANVVFVTPKPIEEEMTKNHQDNENETKNSREEDGCLKIIKEGNVNDSSQESIGVGPIQNFEDDKKETTNLSKGETASVRACESIALGTIHNTESLENIPGASQQEEGLQGDSGYLAPTEASANNEDKNASTAQVVEDKNDNRLAETTENSAKVTPQGEEDLQQGLQINESPENILGASLVKQKGGLQGEVENQYSTESSIENRDEVTSSIKNTEIGARAIGGEEETDHALKNDEPGETDREVESPGEVFDTAKQGNGLQADDDNLVPPETSINKRDELTSSVNTFGDNHENNRLAEATENSAKTTPEGEDSEPPSQGDETGESIALETAHGVEMPKDIPDLALVKQDEGLQEECEKITPEAEIEKRHEDTSYVKVVEDKDVNLSEATENRVKATPEGQEDSEHALHKHETRESTALKTDHGVENPKNVHDSALVKQEEVLLGEVENRYSTASSIENRDKETSSIKVAEDNDKNNRPVETTENHARVTQQGEEERDQVLLNDEPGETDREVESPGEVRDTVKQGNGLQGDDDKVFPQETSINKRDDLISSVGMYGDNHENNRLAEALENSAKTTSEGEDSEPPLTRDETAETTTLETNHGVEVPKNIPDPALVKQEEGLQAECEELASTEAEIEKGDGDTSYVKVTEDNYANNKLVEATENSTKTTPEGEEDPEKSIVLETAHGIEIPKNISDLALVKQEEGLQAECEKIALPEAEIEKRHEDTSCVKVVEDKDVNNSLAEATENSAKATPEGLEDSQHALHEHETRESIALETYHGVESPKNIPDSALVKQEEVLQGEVENQYSTESSIESRDGETSSIKVAKDNDENNRQAETTENHARVVQQGDEETDHVLQKDESGETNCEAERPREILDTVKQWNYLQEDDDNLVPETSCNKKDELTSSVEVFGDKIENNGQAEAKENSEKTTPESEEDSGHALQRDETGECIAHETNHGVEGPKNTPDPALVKQKEGLQAECEKLAPTEAEIEKRQGYISYSKVAEDNNANNKLAEDTKRNTKIPSESGEDSYKALLTDEPGETIRGLTNHNVEGPENNLDSLLVKQGEGMQGEGDNLGQTKTSIKVAEDEDNIRPIETTRNSIKVILKGEEDSEHVLQKDDPQQKPILERNHDVEKPEENLDKSLVNQEEDLQVQGEHLVPTEASMENKDEDIPNVKMAGHKAENNMQDEDRENSPKGTPKVEDSEHSLNKDARGEIIGCEADHEIESLEKIDSSPLVNQEVFLQGEGENLISKEASEERRDEDTSYMKIANCNDNDDNDGVAAEAADISVKATTKGEENLDQVLQKDEPGKQPEQLLDVVSEDKEPEYILEKMENTTLMKEEGIIQNLEETLEVEKKEETKTVDDKKEKEAAIEKVFNTTSFSEEIGVQMAEEIHNIRDRSPEFNEKELTKENSIEEQQYGALETAASSTNTEKSVIEKPATAELPSSSDEKETVKERIKEEESDVTVLKEEAGGTTLEFIKQTEATELTEKAKAENLQDCAGQSRDFTALTTIENYSFMPEVPVEEINEKLLKQEKNTIIDSDSASEAVVTEEGLKETKPDKKEHVKSFDIVPEEKGLATFETGVSLDSVDIEVQSEENSKSEEIMGKKILTVPDETGEKIEHQMEDKAPTGGIDNELSLTTRETTLDGISGDGSRDYYIMPLQEHVPTATAVGKIMEETSARDEIIDEIAKIPSSVQKTDEKLIQKEDESINPTDASELLSSDDGKDSAIEELKHADAELHMPPKRHIEKNSYETEDVEISKRGETSDLADQTEVCKLESLEVENPSDDPSKPIAVSPYQGSEKTILEQGDFVQTEGILTGVLVEKGTTGMKTNVCSQECEPTNTKNDELLAEKNLESDDLDPKLVFITESGHKDPSHETLPKTNKSQTEENNNDVQDWNFESVEPQIKPQVQGKTETKMAMETKLKAEDRINVSQTTKETITTHIVTEGVHERIQEVSGSEGINEQAIHGESELKETQKVSAEDYALEKVEDCGTKSTDYLEATDSNEQTETVKTDIQEPTREKETSGTKALKEEKLQDEFSLKPEDVTTTVVEDSEEKIKVEVDQFLEDSDNATVVPTKSIVGEVPMDDKAVKETSSDERLETITIQPHPQTEEVGSKNFRMEAVDGSESIKEQAIEQESQLKEIYEVSTEDDILKKMEDYGTKSSNYLEAKDPKKHTETIQEPTRETEASGTKAQAEEKIQDEVSLKHVDVSKTEAEDTKETIKEKIEVEADNFLDKNDNTTMVPAKPPIQEAHMDDNSNESLKTTTIQPCPQAEEVGNKKLQIEEVDGSEGIKEQAIHAASELKETHKVYVEDDILEKVEDFGTKSSDYQEETDYNEQIETLKADIKETARETEASGTKVYAEDGIVEKVEGCVRKSSDVSVETIPIQPSPQAEEVGSKKLQIEEVDGSEAIKEQVIHVESELKKIQKVYVEDDIVEKVEDCGRKSSNYLEETSSIKQTETITANTQELTRETEVSETKAPEEEKIQGEDNLKPVEISTTEAECTKEMIKEKIKVKADKFLDGDDNATVVPAESTIREAHMDEEVGKETRTDESVETIPIQLCPPAEEVGSKKLQIEEGDRSEGIKDQATHAEIELKEIHKVYAEDDMVEKVEDCGRKSPDYLEDTDSSEQTEAHTTNIQEPTKETKASRNNALEDVMIQDEVSLKHVEISTTEAKDTNEAIKEKMETDKFLDEDDNVNAVPAESTIREAHMDEETVKETRSDESVETIPIQPCTQAEEVGSKKLQIEEVDVSEGIKEQAIHAESELKEIHKVYAEDDILEKVKEFGTKSSDYQEETNSNEQTKIFKADVQETTRETEALGAKVYAEDNIVEKVEDSGRKSSEYQEEKDSIKQTETLTADFQEPTRETEASDSKALEEEKIQGEIRLKPAESSTTKVEDTKEKIEENIKVEADKFIDGDDNATAVPTESTRREAHMDDKAIKETRSDESVETIPIQPHPQVEEVGSKKLQIEEVEGSEGIKEHATHAESELKEIHKVYAEDDILEKVEEFGKKSADYKEETDSSELTKTLKVDGQETTRVTEASGSTVFAEDDIVEKVEDCGRKSSDYLKEIDSNKKTETFKPDIQEPTREIETSGRKAPEEGKIQDEVSLKPIEISTTETEDTKETIKENIKVETDKFLNEDDNATMVPTESPVREAHVDDEAVKETRLDGSVESIPIEPCPQPEEVSSKNLQIEEVDGSEGIKEQAIHAESELKEIHKVYAEDDILDKVEEFGKKSPDYLEETDSSGQTETLTVDIQEPTRETEASGTKAPEEVTIQDRVSLKPIEISTIDAEDTKGTIKQTIKVEPDKFLDKDDNKTAVPAESTIREAHMDDEAVKETRSDESVETIPIQPCPLIEEVGSKKPQIEEIDVSEGIKGQATHAESELKEIHKVYAEDDILEKVKDFETKSSDYQEETNSNEQTEVLKADVQETTREIEASGAKVCAEDDIVEKVEDYGRKSSDYLAETSSIKQTETITADTQELTRDTEASETNPLEEEKIQGEVSLKPAEISTTEAEGTSETIKEKIKVDVDKFHDEDDNATAVPTESTIREAHMDDEAVKETRSDESVETIPIQPCPLLEEVSSKKLQIEEVDVGEGIKEQATHVESELKEIHKVYAADDILEKVKDFGTKSFDYQEETNSNEQIEVLKADVQETTREIEASGAKVCAEDDIVEKVEDCGRKSSDYLVETSSIKRTETITADTQELTRDTEASETNALEEEKIQGEVSLKPEEISTTEAEGTKETIKAWIKVEPNIFLDEVDNATAVPTESTIREAHMDDEAVKETRSDESVETIPIQPCLLLEEVGSKKPQIEEVDVSEGIKEQATHAESELKEIHKVYVEDDILEKVKDFETKSSDYQEETNSNEQTEVLKADVQETTREIEASGAKVCAEDDIVEKVEDCGRKSSDYLVETSSIKQTETIKADTQELTRDTEASETNALEEEKIQGEVSLKPAEISTTEAPGTSETIKEKIKVEANKFHDEDDNATAVPIESSIREVHMDDEAVKETRSNESVEKISIQPCPLPKEVSSKKLQIEEVDVSEGIKEQATHAKSELKEIHKVYATDDILEKVKDFGTKSPDYQEETNSNEQIEIIKANVQETTRETEASGAKVYAEDDIVEKVEDCGRKSPVYLEETSSIKQTETITANTQELTRETEASETKALEEEKIPGEVSLKPAEISTTEAESTKETIKEKIRVEADKFLDEGDSETTVPAKSTIREAHMDDEAVKETRSNESVETIPIQPCPLLEEVGSKKLQIEEVDVSEGIKEQATHAESELKEIHKVYAADDILEKVKDFGTKSFSYQEEINSNEQTEILKADVQETTRETEASRAKVCADDDIVEKVTNNYVEDCGRKSSYYLEETSLIKQTETITANTQELTRETEPFETKALEEEKIQGEVSLKPAEISTTEAEGTKETIKARIKVEPNIFLDEVDNATAAPVESTIREAHMDDEGVKETRSDESVETISIQPCPLPEEVGSKKLQIEEVDVSEGIKEQATHAESELKEIHKVYAEDDILEKVKDFGTKSSDYQEETNSNEQTEILKADVQETTRETEALGAKVYAEDNIVEKVEDCGRKSSDYLEETSSIKQTETITADTQELTRETKASETNALEEEKIQGEVNLKPAEISTTKAEGTRETIKEKIEVKADKFHDEDDNATAVPTESTIREAHMDDEAVKETRSDESVESIPIQPCPLLEEVGSKKLQIEEVDVSEGIKEQATHAESELDEIQKVYAEDDILEKVKEFGTKSSDYQEETSSNEQAEILKADVQETTRETEASGAKVYAENDIVEKVEDCGRKSSDYLEETSSIKQTETITANTQELTRETEASKTKAPDEEKIPREVSFKPTEISTTKVESTKETIKEKIRVEADKFLDEVDNETTVPAELTIREAHMDDEAVKETRSDECVETIPIQPCPLLEEVGRKKLQIEEVDVSEGIKEQATQAKSKLKEMHKVYAEDDIHGKVKDFGIKSSDYQVETNSNEQTEILTADVRETTKETEASDAKVYAEYDIVEKVEDCGRKSLDYLEEPSSIKQTETITTDTQELTRETEASKTKAPEEEKIQGEVSLKPAEISTTEAESTKETIKEKIKVEADKFLNEDDSETAVLAKSTIREAYMDDKSVKETRSDESVETIPIRPCPLPEELGCQKLQSEEVDVGEGIKEQATHAESELTEIHKVYAEDDILEKEKDFGTKSSDYHEETNSNEQKEIFKADVQETTRETEASGAKVYAEDDIVEKVEDYGRKSSDYLEETSSIKQTETITADTQELTRETETSERKVPEEEKIKGKVSLKPAEISTTDAEGTKEMIKEQIKVEADKFLDEVDNATAVPAKSTIREAHMDDEGVKKARSDESVETIPIQPCPLPEEVGSKKLQIEEVDVSEGIKEQATHAESELKEIHKVYAEDDVLEKLKDFGTKSSDYQEETNSNEQTEILKADVQETTREKEASSSKVYAEDDIIEKVEACGRKSSDYLVETSSIKQTKTITANTQELTRDTKASETNALEEEKIQGEVSLKPAEISTTEAEGTSETIKEKIKVEADKFHDEDDNATAVPTESTIREAHMDDEVVKETTSDGSVETIPIQPCPLVEEVGSKKLQNEEVDVSEGIKEQATHVESELKVIHKVYAEDYILEKVEEFGKKSADYKEETDHSKLTETLKADVQETTRVIEASGSKVYAKDDMFEKVENYGTKSSDYLEETDSNKQTVTITADIQETTGETESSGRKASEERKIQDEVSLKPVQISTTKAEDTKEMIKENIKVEVDKFLHEDHNATMVPTKSPVGEAHMDDEAVKETRSDESVETIPIQYCPLSKEVGSKKLQIEEVDVSEGIKEQATHAESELKEIHKVYAEYDILEKVKNFGTKSSDYLEETDSNEQIETLKADVQETTRETKVSETKALEEGKIQDKVSLEHVEISTTEAEDTKEMIKEKIKVEADKFLDEDDNATMVPVESTVREAHMDDEAVKETRLDESVETIPIQPCPQAEEVGSKKLQIEEVDGSEGIKEQATHAESELKEIHKVYAEDDILEKVKDFGTKSSDYQEETDTNKQTKILKADVQETTRDTKASGAKVYAEYDIVEKVEDYGRKSFDYLEETCSIKQTETITANTQELTMETGAFGIKAPEEEKIQDKVSLKLVDVLRTEAEDTKEMIKEKVKVEADNILDEDDNATMVPAESPIRVAHMDDKVVKETILDKSLETITIQPCPQAEDFGIEEVDESEGIKEQAMHGERELKESHRVSAEDDILQKVEDYGTKSSNYLEATNPSEQAATVKANIQELTMETELSGTKAPEEENIQDEVSLKPANVSTREAEDAKEKIKEYIEVEVGKCLDENDNATAVPAESHIGEAHMDVEAVKEISLDESLETSTIENIRLEQEGPMAHKNEEKESVTPVKPGADEVEDAKTIPNAVICSKYLGVEETQETGQSLRVEKLDSDRTEEGIKEDSGTLSEAKYLGIEMVTQGEMTSGQTLPTGNREEEFQTLSSALLSLEQEHGPKFIVKEAEAIKIMEEEIIDDKNIDDSLAIKATEDACLQNKEQLQTLSSALLSEEQKHEAQTEFKKTEEESTKEVETLDDKNMNNFSAIKESEERGLEQEEPMDHEHVEKESATLEKQDTDEAEVTKTVSAADSRPKYFGVEETHEIGESLRVEKLDSEGNEEGVKESSVTVFKSESLGIETVTKDVMTPDQTLPAVILEDHFQIASSELHSLGQEHGPTTAFTDTEAIKTTKVKMLDDETCLQEEVSESLKSTDTNEVEETKTASGTVFESKYQTDETGERLTVEKLDAAEGKETKGTSETSSNSKALCVEADSKDEVIAGQTLAAGKLGEQLQTLSSSFLSREQEHRPTTAAERTEEEEMEEAKIIGDESIDNSSAAKTTEGTCLKMKEHVELEVSTLGLESSKATHNGSSNEIQEEEGSKLDQASKLDSHEKEEMKYDDSPSGVQSPLVLPKSEDMKEKHLEAAMSDLNAEENWCKETVEENQIFKNQISMEEVREVMEEKEVAKDSQSVSPAEETIIESHQGDELKAEECPEEETNKTFKATTKANQHEALKLPELIDKDSANENIEKKITAEESSYLDEAEGKNIEKAVSEQDLDYKSGETRITKEKTEVITLGEKETGVEISQKEGTAGFSEVNEITEDIQQLENYAVSEIKIPGEEEPSENKEAAFITDNEDVLPVLQHPSDKALQEVELEHERPGKATEVDAEERGIECEGEKRMGASGEINKESASVDSAKMSLSGLMQRSMKKKLQEAKNLTKEREPMPSKAEIQNEEAETTQIDKARADEEEGDEHKRSEPDSDAPVMVEASKDTYAKVPHKKSHNILSGVGSKVKHSLSKVKKAITGKSSHPKTSSPK